MAHHSDTQWFAAIGAIIVRWGVIEKLVSSMIHSVELSAAIASGTMPAYTNLRALRDFKARKGRLRKLFEQHASPNELAKLDVIYRRLIDPGRIRHSLAHDIVVLERETDELTILVVANFGGTTLPHPLSSVTTQSRIF